MATEQNSEALLHEVRFLEVQADACRKAGNIAGAELSEGTARALRKMAGVDCDECGRVMDCPPDGASGIRLCMKCGGTRPENWG